MSHQIIHNEFFSDFIGCPYPYCRQRICDFQSVTGYFQHGFIIDSKDGVYTESGHCLLCINCQQYIGDSQTNGVLLECYRYIKKVNNQFPSLQTTINFDFSAIQFDNNFFFSFLFHRWLLSSWPGLLSIIAWPV